jgi:hypothetical protein
MFEAEDCSLIRVSPDMLNKRYYRFQTKQKFAGTDCGSSNEDTIDSLDDLRNKRLKAIMQPDYSRQFKLWRPFSDIKTTNQFQVISDLSWSETLAL